MKKLIYLVMMFGASMAQAQDKQPQPAATATVQSAQVPYPNAPEITFSETEHSFGITKKGQPVVYKFEFKNTGKEDLVISNCRAGCECTKAQCAKDPVKPGKTGFIEVHYDSTRIGKFGKEVMVYSNARKAVVFLVIRGEIEDAQVPVNKENVKSPADNKIE